MVHGIPETGKILKILVVSVSVKALPKKNVVFVLNFFVKRMFSLKNTLCLAWFVLIEKDCMKTEGSMDSLYVLGFLLSCYTLLIV